MISSGPRLTSQTLKVLSVLMSPTNDGLSGAEIGRVTDLASGTLYPILLRLEKAKWLESQWENGDPSQLGRPRRRLYRITGIGFRRAKAAFRELVMPLKEFAWF
jgi:PadR family transcriptional regulator, regulatory protein PadR